MCFPELDELGWQQAARSKPGQMALNVGEQVEFHFDGEKLIIEKSDEVSPFNHRDLVRALKRAQRQRAEKVDFGAPRGKEIL
jgi:antitoxin component of MazEF toxin-antitoxin module